MTQRHFITNPGLELGSTAWTLESGGTILADANARQGAWVLRHIGDSATRTHYAQPFPDARPGCKVSMSAWFKGGTAGNARVRARFYDSAGVVISSQDGNTLSSGSGSYVQSTLTDAIAPSRTKSVRFAVLFAGTPTGTWYVDDLDAWGDTIDTIPTTAKIASHRLFLARTEAAFEPLVGPTKFSEFNAGMNDKWSGVFNFIPLRPADDLGELVAFVERLGRDNKFFAFDPDRTVPKNGVVNGMVVDGAGQTGTSLLVRSAPVSATPLVAGDYFECADQYYQLTRDFRTGPASTGRLVFKPAIRTSPADGEAIITNAPKMVARITSEVPRSSTHDKWTALSVSWEEV